MTERTARPCETPRCLAHRVAACAASGEAQPRDGWSEAAPRVNAGASSGRRNRSCVIDEAEARASPRDAVEDARTLASAAAAGAGLCCGLRTIGHRDANPAEADAGGRRLVFATRKNLEKLARHATAADAMAAARAAAVVRVQPEMVRAGEGWRLRTPAEADYGGDAFELLDAPAV